MTETKKSDMERLAEGGNDWTEVLDFEALAKPFSLEDVTWRIQSAGKSGSGKVWAICLVYVTNRAIMERLDKVCGPENWRNEFKAAPEGGTLCGISIRVRGEWITKWDGAEKTAIDAVKGGLSSSMKRAAVQWGLGRYLYKIKENFGKTAGVDRNTPGSEKGQYIITDPQTKQKTYHKFWWTPPALPEFALPEGEYKEPPPPPPAPETPPVSEQQDDEGRASETTTKDYDYLTAMRTQKTRVGDYAYYETLISAGKGEYEKSNFITDKEEQKTVYRALLALPDKEKV